MKASDNLFQLCWAPLIFYSTSESIKHKRDRQKCLLWRTCQWPLLLQNFVLLVMYPMWRFSWACLRRSKVLRCLSATRFLSPSYTDKLIDVGNGNTYCENLYCFATLMWNLHLLQIYFIGRVIATVWSRNALMRHMLNGLWNDTFRVRNDSLDDSPEWSSNWLYISVNSNPWEPLLSDFKYINHPSPPSSNNHSVLKIHEIRSISIVLRPNFENILWITDSEVTRSPDWVT